jgi:hypothetical protein
MAAYVRGRFALRVFGREHVRIEPGQIFAPSHRSDNDVPVLITVLYPAWSAAIARGAAWPTFGAMIELFLPGFFAGYPARIPLTLRRLAWPYQPGGVLERHLQCVPVREPDRMRLQELLRHDPDERLEDLLPAELMRLLGARAAALGRGGPVRAADVSKGHMPTCSGPRSSAIPCPTHPAPGRATPAPLWRRPGVCGPGWPAAAA